MTNFSRSLFERLLHSGYEKTMLKIQYRMHPAISSFPSQRFYDGLIGNADCVLSRDLPWPIVQLRKLMKDCVNVFFDLQTGHESTEQQSKFNREEAKFTRTFCELIAWVGGAIREGERVIRTDAPSLNDDPVKGMIGVITPYKQHVSELSERCRAIFDRGGQHVGRGGVFKDYLEINTVDAFQGREKDIIIFNCVRSSQ